ncbi:MAG: type IA DNA topoisomerase [Clostridia bacterium]|nr:type IA DNA topoisomerase [Clostridia bacterium]
MEKTLILAEKPSVARNIGDALGNVKKNEGYLENENYIITWAFGHLLSLYDIKDYDETKTSWQMAYYPFIPKVFEYKVKPDMKDPKKPDSGAKKQLNIIRNLMKRLDVHQIISACDYDREGQIIGDIIFKVLKPSQPVYRLLLNEWTQSAILEGLRQLKSNEQMIPLRDAGISRQWADWVIGINLTAVSTLKYGHSKKVLNIGRVLLPTLKIIYDRDQKIKNFVKEDYFKLSGLFIKGNDAFEAIYFNESKDKFSSKGELESILEDLNYPDALKSLKGVVASKEINEKKEYPPALYNLTQLQGDITSRFRNWTSDKVLKVAQQLYEKKLITYPRTSSVALEESLISKTEQVLEVHKKDLPYKEDVTFKVTKRIFNNDKVESHSAIMPTYMLPKNLTEDELTIYYAIKNRFIAQFMPPAVYEEVKLVLDVSGYMFQASGKVELERGWKKIEQKNHNDHVLPHVEEGEALDIRALNITTHETKPPNHHTEKTLLKVMETCGKNIEDDDELIQSVLSGYSIGTPATRAETISKLKRIGYIEQQNKSLLVTELGCQLVETFPIHELFDLEYTGRLEKKLQDIQKGQLTRSGFLKDIFIFTAHSVMTIKNHEKSALVLPKEEKDILGICPSCGGNITENPKGFGCDRWKDGCKFTIWKNDKFLASMQKKPTKAMVKKVLKDGRVMVKGLVGKNGNKFDAYLKYEKKEDGPYYQWKIEFK